MPAPARARISISPFKALKLARTTSKPTPRPANSVLTGAVENPGWNSIRADRARSARSAVSGETSPRSIAALAHPFVIDSAPVVFHFNVDVIAAMVGAHGSPLPLVRLARS